MSGRAWVKKACASWLVAWSCLAAAASGGWHYTIDQSRENQQANFCDHRDAVKEIATIFSRFGARTGYAALSASPNCEIAVKSFTPRKILATVIISKGKPGEYVLRFVEIENADGDVLYLVTTRDVVVE